MSTREQVVSLDALPGVSYRYEQNRQRLHFITNAAALKPTLDGPKRPELVDVVRAFAAVLNYDLSFGVQRDENEDVRANVAQLRLDLSVLGASGHFVLQGLSIFRSEDVSGTGRGSTPTPGGTS